MTQPAFPAVREWVDISLGFFYPPVCQVCGEHRATAPEGYVCAGCWRHVRFIQPPLCDRCGLPFEGALTGEFECTNCREMDLHFTHARAAVVANAFLLEILHRFKYQRQLWFQPFLAELLLRQAIPVLREGRWDFIIPIPLHAIKQREREFNQAELLARELGAALQVPVNLRAVQRCLPTRTQTRLTRRERAENMRGAFRGGEEAGLEGTRVILVDDVLTTGATTSACAQALRKLGAAEVVVWTLARGL